MRSILTMAVVVASAGILSGCGGIVVRDDARTKYQQSLADYRSCLTANNANVQACEGKRLIMETDEKAFNNFAAARRSF